MRRKLALTALFAAWLCANGVVWNVVQVVAWAKMFHDYSDVMPAAKALRLTFSGEAPCDLCHLAESGQKAAREQVPPEAVLGAGAEKILFVADCTPVVLVAGTDPAWPGAPDAAGLTRTEAVPVPPPRA